MSCPLAIITPEVGVPSQTFVRRHIERLAPRGTAVLTGRVMMENDKWSIAGPLLELDCLSPGPMRRRIDAAARQVGWRTAGYSVSVAKRFLRDHGVKVIMGEFLDSSLHWLAVARELEVRFYGHAHGNDVSRRLRDPKWRAAYLQYNRADGVITMSRFSEKKLLNLGMSPSKLHVVPYGVDVPDEPIGRPEQELVRCLAVGRMVGKKGPILVLDAFRRAAEMLSNVRLDFVGTGALLPAARQFIQAFRLESRVTLHGGQPNETVQRIMEKADVFLQHSITDPTDGSEEGLPVAILEAMASALPVVSTRHAGIGEAVEEGITGFLVEEGDSSSMADRIVLLARQREIRHRMGNAGWKRAKEMFSWEKERERLLQILGVPR